MKLVFADESLLDTLDKLADGSGTGLYWKLFTNDYTPIAGSTLAAFTFPAGAWNEIQVPVADFTLRQLSAHQASIQAENIVFTNGSGGLLAVYGYAVLNDALTKIIAAARFDDAPIALADGAGLPVAPVLGVQSYYEAG